MYFNLKLNEGGQKRTRMPQFLHCNKEVKSFYKFKRKEKH